MGAPPSVCSRTVPQQQKQKKKMLTVNETPTPRKFLVPKRSTQQAEHATPASTAPKFFSSTPRVGGSTQRGIEDVEDVASDEDGGVDEVEGEVQNVQGSIELNEVGDEVVPDSIGVDGKSVSDSIDVEDGEETVPDSVNDGKEILRDSIDVDDDMGIPDSIDVNDGKEITSDPIEHRDGTRKPSSDLSDESLDQRNVKRRRLSEGRGPEPQPHPHPHTNTVADPARPKPAKGGAPPTQAQPVFRPPPRFKQAPEEQDRNDILPAVFSPQRKGAKYITGGLAAELQGWLSDIKNQDGPRAAEQVRFTVEEVKVGVRMYLVTGTVDGERTKVMLAGEGKLSALGRRPVVTEGSRVALGQLGWDIVLDGEKWNVACDWTLL